MTPTERARLYTLIDEACTNNQIRNLLRDKKEIDKKIRISGTSAELLRHLRDAHGRGIVTESDLVQLLASGEENGRQYIFFHRLRPQARSKYKNVQNVYERTIAALGANPDRLPRFVLQPKQRVLSDIRLQSLPNDDHNLVVKWYSGRTVQKIVNEEKFERNGMQYIRREIKIEEARLVSLARYLPRGLLEIRIPTGERESRKTVLQEHAEIERSLGDVFDMTAFHEMELSQAMKTLIDTSTKKNAKHRVSSTRASDGDASAEFNPGIEGEDLFSSHKHRDALKLYDDFASLDVYWQSPIASDGQVDEIRCQTGIYGSHCVRIGSKRVAEEIDYVVNRYWELCK